jgi:hypothetical protein
MAINEKTGSTILSSVYDPATQSLKTVGTATVVPSDATQDEPANDTTTQISAEAKDFDGGALPNSVDEGDAIRPAVTRHGVSYVLLTNADGSLSAINATGNIKIDIEEDSVGVALEAGNIKNVSDALLDVWNSSTNLLRVSEQSPQPSRYTSPTALVSSPQDLTASFATMGSVITNLEGYRFIRVPFRLDGNDSRDVAIQVTYEITASGTINYILDPSQWELRYSALDTTQSYRTLTGTVGASHDGDYEVVIFLQNAPPTELKVRVVAGTVGASVGNIISASYIKGY